MSIGASVSFKVVILGDGSAVASRLTQVLDDHALRFTYVDSLCLSDTVKFSDSAAWIELLNAEKATVVVNLQFPTTDQQAEQFVVVGLCALHRMFHEQACQDVEDSELEEADIEDKATSIQTPTKLHQIERDIPTCTTSNVLKQGKNRCFNRTI